MKLFRSLQHVLFINCPISFFFHCSEILTLLLLCLCEISSLVYGNKLAFAGIMSPWGHYGDILYVITLYDEEMVNVATNNE